MSPPPFRFGSPSLTRDGFCPPWRPCFSRRFESCLCDMANYTVFTGYRLSANDTNLICVSPSSTTGCNVKQGVRFHMLRSGVTTQYFFSIICSLAVSSFYGSESYIRYFNCNFQCHLVAFDRNRLVSCCFRIPSEDLESPRGPAGPVTVHSN